MTPAYENHGITLYAGHNRNLLSVVPPGAATAIVTDPPYNIDFMGKGWDRRSAAFRPETWATFRTAVRPGGWLLAFGSPRTFHRLWCAVEDGGWDIKDTLCWLHGQGFPKHKSLLKPAWEPILLARNPGTGTVAANVLAHGTGALNIDACRIGTGEDRSSGGPSGMRATGKSYGGFPTHAEQGFNRQTGGRWPANVILDEDAAALLDAQSGTLKTHGGGQSPKTSEANVYGTAWGYTERDQRFNGDTGGASRFFYCAKASRSERNAGLEGMPERDVAQRYGLTAGGSTPQQTPHLHRPQANHHPTVKPLALMRWLVGLVAAPGDCIIDPYTGSGTTFCAAAQLGVGGWGWERNPENAAIAARRIAYWAGQPAE